VTKNNDPKVLANLINCLSVLENDTFLLYKNLSNKLEHPLLRSLLVSIAEDSQKHSTLLKGVAESIAKTKGKLNNCEKNTGKVWRLVADLTNEIASKESLSEKEMPRLWEKLTFLESSYGEEYYMFVQMKTLQTMMREINQIYKIDLGSLRSIFDHIISDEEHHREVLATIKSILEPQLKADNNPLVRYQNPDSWISPNPATG
jgi:rubrerythrin